MNDLFNILFKFINIKFIFLLSLTEILKVAKQRLHWIFKCLCHAELSLGRQTPLRKQTGRQTGGEEVLFQSPSPPIYSRPFSALVGGIQGPLSCKQKHDTVLRAWVSPPRRPAGDTRSGPALGTGLI